MSLSLICPNCDARVRVSDDFTGRRVRCRSCGELFAVRRGADAENGARQARSHDEYDDEPRRTRRADRHATKSARPVGMWVCIGLVALLIIAGAAGAVVHWAARNDAPVDFGPPPGLPPGFESDTGLWVEHQEPAGRYRVKFPGTPRTVTQPHEGPKGENFDLIVHLYDMDANETFLAAHKPVPDVKGRLTTDYILDEAFSNKRFRPQRGVEQARRPITYQGFPGREIVLEFPDRGWQGVGRLILTKDRIILLVASGREMSPQSARAKAFFETLKIE